jgi:hypothetical protein
MAEMVTHGINGILFPKGDALTLAAHLARVVDEPAILEKLRAGVPPVKTTDQEVIEIEAIYRDLLEPRISSSAPIGQMPTCAANTSFGGDR